MVLALLAIGGAPSAAPAQRSLGKIDFFGYKGLDLAAVRAALPVREGDSFPPRNVKSDDLKRQVGRAITQVIGSGPTDVAFVCCDSKQNWGAFIGLPGASYEALAFNPLPTGDVRLPKDALKRSDELDRALESAIMSGHSTEDQSQGYALSDDPKARKAALAMRDYALQHEDLLFQVLA